MAAPKPPVVPDIAQQFASVGLAAAEVAASEEISPEAAKEEKRRKHRANVKNEMLETERTYVRSIGTLVQVRPWV